MNSTFETTEVQPRSPSHSSYRELLALAWPLVVSNSFTTIQVTIDRIFLSQYDPSSLAASITSVMIFWTIFIVLSCTASYVSTFVAQYGGAGRSTRIGPAVWQALYFSLAAGIGMMGLAFFSEEIVGIARHNPELKRLEAIYFFTLCWLALPNLIVVSISAFFSGRGDSRIILWINGIGTICNGGLGYCWIFGKAGFPEWGIEGAGWALVISTWISALFAIWLFFRKQFRQEYATLSGWHLDIKLFLRLMRYGLPNGTQWLIDSTAFTVFLVLAEWFGGDIFKATSIAYSINAVIYVPIMGLGQAVAVLVGRKLGENNPDEAALTTLQAFYLATGYMIVVSALFIFLPSLFIAPFASDHDPEEWQRIAGLLKYLLYFIAFYSLFDGIVLVYSFALRGAGDTIYVTLVALVLSWPIMVLPTILVWYWDLNFYWAWVAASLYIACQATAYWLRFRQGKWREMRVIEKAPIEMD